MSIQAFELFKLGPEVVAQFLATATEQHERPDWGLTTFSGFPTAMVFRPDDAHVGSLHYMFFPSRARQGFHHHPGGRYIVLVGDVDMHVHHSPVGVDCDPQGEARTLVVPARTFAAIRFPAFFWHCFETKSDAGCGVLALAFHDDDKIDGTARALGDDLMEERTVYWRDA